jgi:hypothetical protein
MNWKSQSFSSKKSLNQLKSSNRNKSREHRESHTYRNDSKHIFQNASIDSKMENTSRNISPKKLSRRELTKNESSISTENDMANRTKILSNMNFNVPQFEGEYELREQLATNFVKKVPSLIVAGLSQNKWKHLPRVDIQIPRTHKELTTFEPARRVNAVSKKPIGSINKIKFDNSRGRLILDKLKSRFDRVKSSEVKTRSLNISIR